MSEAYDKWMHEQSKAPFFIRQISDAVESGAIIRFQMPDKITGPAMTMTVDYDREDAFKMAMGCGFKG